MTSPRPSLSPILTVVVAGAISLGGCTSGAPATSATQLPLPASAAPLPTTAAEPENASPASSVQPAPPTTEPSAGVVEYRETYAWAVPSRPVTIRHTVNAPIAPPPALPLPALVAVYTGDHPEYQRISFYFRGAFPEYTFQYVQSITADGSGEAIPLEGNGFVQIVFVGAQAHDDAGHSTIKATPKNPIGDRNLRSYADAGDFEGHVSYGLGIQTAPDSDQVLPIRAGELRKADGAGGFYYVVHFDVMAG